MISLSNDSYQFISGAEVHQSALLPMPWSPFFSPHKPRTDKEWEQKGRCLTVSSGLLASLRSSYRVAPAGLVYALHSKNSFFYLSSLLSGVRQGTCQKYFFKKKNPPSCPIISPFTSHSLLLSSLRHIRRPITGAGNIWGHNWTGRQSGKKKEGAEESSWAVNPAVTYIYQGGASLRVKIGSKHFSAIISGKAPRGLGS